MFLHKALVDPVNGGSTEKVTTIIVLFGPTLAAMCASVCCFKKNSQKNASIAALSF